MLTGPDKRRTGPELMHAEPHTAKPTIRFMRTHTDRDRPPRLDAGRRTRLQNFGIQRKSQVRPANAGTFPIDAAAHGPEDQEDYCASDAVVVIR